MSPAPREVARSLGGLSEAELDELMALAEPFELDGGVLFRQGDVADSMYVIEDGEIEILARTSGDERIALGRSTKGAVLGELSLIDRGLRSATATATKPTSGFRLGQHAFQMLRAARRPVSTALLAHLEALTCERIRARAAELAATMDRAAAPAFEVRPEIARERWGAVATPSLDPRTALLLPFFKALSTREREALLARGTTYAVRRGERLSVSGAPADATMIVLRGAVAVSIDRDGRRERCGLTPPGRVVSVVASIDRGPVLFDAAAREDTLFLRIDADALAELRAAKNELAFKLEDALVSELVRELRVVTSQLARLAAHGRTPLRA